MGTNSVFIVQGEPDLSRGTFLCFALITPRDLKEMSYSSVDELKELCIYVAGRLFMDVIRKQIYINQL